MCSSSAYQLLFDRYHFDGHIHKNAYYHRSCNSARFQQHNKILNWQNDRMGKENIEKLVADKGVQNDHHLSHYQCDPGFHCKRHSQPSRITSDWLGMDLAVQPHL